MTPKLDYRWKLRAVMADRGMFATADLRPLLIERGITLSPSQIYRLVVDKPERLNLSTLMALLDILGCSIDDLIEPVAAEGARRSAAGAATAGVGEFRPKRARVTPGPSS